MPPQPLLDEAAILTIVLQRSAVANTRYTLRALLLSLKINAYQQVLFGETMC